MNKDLQLTEIIGFVEELDELGVELPDELHDESELDVEASVIGPDGKPRACRRSEQLIATYQSRTVI